MPRATWGRRPAAASSSRTARPASSPPRTPACASLPSPAARMRASAPCARPSTRCEPDLIFDDMRATARPARAAAKREGLLKPEAGLRRRCRDRQRARGHPRPPGRTARPRRASDRDAPADARSRRARFARTVWAAVCAGGARRATRRRAARRGHRRHRLRRHLLAGGARPRRRPAHRLDVGRRSLGHHRLARSPRARRSRRMHRHRPPRARLSRRRHVAGDGDAEADVAEAPPARDAGTRPATSSISPIS